MINSNDTVMRLTRMSVNWSQVSEMYKKALGFDELIRFENEDGFDGVVLGHNEYGYHLEFTSHPSPDHKLQPVADSFLVFYIPDTMKWEQICRSMIEAGFKYVDARNPHWKRVGKTYEDRDGYRVVIQNRDFYIP